MPLPSRAVLLLLLLTLSLACGQLAPRPTIFDCSKEDCRDCAVLATKLSWDQTRREQCQTCQGADAGTTTDGGLGCSNFPVENGRIVVRGCNVDGDCPPLAGLCGRYLGHPHNTCVNSDAH